MTAKFETTRAGQSPARPTDLYLLEVLDLLEYGQARDKENLGRGNKVIEWQRERKKRLKNKSVDGPVDETAVVTPRLMDGRTFEDGQSTVFAMDNCFNPVYSTGDDVPEENRDGWPLPKDYALARALHRDGRVSSHKFPAPLLGRRFRTEAAEPSASGTNEKHSSLEYKLGRAVLDRQAPAPLDEQHHGLSADEDADQNYDFLLENLHPGLEHLIRDIENTEFE